MVVVVKLDSLATVIVRMAVGTVPWPMLAAIEIILGRPFNVVAHHEVKVAVLVIIKPCRAGGPSPFIGYASLGGDIGKRSVAIIMVKDRSVIAGNIEIRITIVIVVAHGATLSVEALTAHARFFGDIGKCAVSIIAIERAAQRLRRSVGRRL